MMARQRALKVPAGMVLVFMGTFMTIVIISWSYSLGLHDFEAGGGTSVLFALRSQRRMPSQIVFDEFLRVWVMQVPQAVERGILAGIGISLQEVGQDLENYVLH